MILKPAIRQRVVLVVWPGKGHEHVDVEEGDHLSVGFRSLHHLQGDLRSALGYGKVGEPAL